MKSISFFLLFLLSFSLCAQETLVEITRLDDSTYVESTITKDEAGRITSQTNAYFNVAEFAGRIVDNNVNAIIAIEQRERQNALAQRDVNTLKRFVNGSLQVSYDSLLTEKLLVALSGDWRFYERSGANTATTNVSIVRHPTTPVLLRMTNKDAAGAWNIRAITTQHFEIRNYTVNGTAEVVELSLTQFAGFTGYRGVASNGTVLILRK